MKLKSTFYHAGCPVCIEAETMIATALDKNRFDVEFINFTEHPDRVAEAEAMGVRSVPAIVMDNQVFHINFGASLAEVKGQA